jgi:hypothetical protein
MKLKRIKGSSNISRVGYDADAKQLTVHFKGGGRYSYAGVPDEVYKALLAADSKGGYFHTHIRGEFEATKL